DGDSEEGVQIAAEGGRDEAGHGRTDVSQLPAAGAPEEDLSRPLVDAEALERWLDQQLGGSGRLDVERHQAGHSCETFFITRGGKDWVLRRPPRGAFLPTAHDAIREYTVPSALVDPNGRRPPHPT